MDIDVVQKIVNTWTNDNAKNGNEKNAFVFSMEKQPWWNHFDSIHGSQSSFPILFFVS